MDRRWLGDMQALEDIENLSLCVKTDEGVRNIYSQHDIDSQLIVLVKNIPTANETSLRFTIKKGQYIRYKKSNDL